ncbi:hypothetical protein [Thermococcus sibiricus]|uniref:Uncharacterized protein n=1 Tax=Thermococcus sibiricus TaxID=172049 RepID=A0A101EKT9_9EURY|nr:hypothetical protein [Thermococcus sibiricus]KUK16755.1 MAG: Uncharacterized protein XD54_1957 [Thermococcus sibiricus]
MERAVWSAKRYLSEEGEVKSFKEKFRIKESNFYLLGHSLTAVNAEAEGAKFLIQALPHIQDYVYLILTRKWQVCRGIKRVCKH